MKSKAEVANQCAKLRETRGFSAAQLAGRIGVTRQTIYAIEAGNYVPNAVLALRLAKVLETNVEDLFQLIEDGAQPPATQAVLLKGSPELQPGQPVQLARVGTRLMASPAAPIGWFLPRTDALIVKASRGGRAAVRLVPASQNLDDRVIVAGCDPGMSVLARNAQAVGIKLVLVHRNSTVALDLLKANCVHIAGCHLRDEISHEQNLPQIGRMFPKKSVAAISLAWCDVGLVTALHNPKAIRSIQDLARRDVCMVNRETGAGARAFLDQELAAGGVPASKVRGYATSAPGHLRAAELVLEGSVDCCVSTRAAAQRFGLGFVPLARERYDLAVSAGELKSKIMQNLFGIVNESNFRKELVHFGYDSTHTGERNL